MAKIFRKEELSEKLSLEDQISLDGSTSTGSKSKVINQDAFEVSDKAKRAIQDAQEEAERIKKHARELLLKVKAEVETAREKGFALGKEQGLKESADFMLKLSAEKQALINHLEKDVMKLVYDISEKIIGQDLSEREESIIGLIKQALQNAMGDHFTITVNPKDLERVKKHKPVLMSHMGSGKVIHLLADEKVKANGCIIQTEMGTIDAELSTQLQVIREVLGLEEEEIPSQSQTNQPEQRTEPSFQTREESPSLMNETESFTEEEHQNYDDEIENKDKNDEDDWFDF